MEDRIEVVVARPGPADIPVLDGIAASPEFSIAAVICETEDSASSWSAERGIPRYGELDEVPRILPGQVVVLFESFTSDHEALRALPARGVSIVNREVARLLFSPGPQKTAVSSRTGAAFKRYLRLLEDFFPASRKASTPVKFTACLTEVKAVWDAGGCAILTGVPGGDSLALTAHIGAVLSGEPAVATAGGSLPARCYNRGKAEVIADLSAGDVRLIGSFRAESAAAVPVRSGDSTLGVLLVWSDRKGHFDSGDIEPLSLYAMYVANLLEMDELSARLEESLVIDPLTGLHNRVQFHHRLGLEIRRAQRYSLNVSLIVFDVDRLEDYNASCGHMLGNLALSDIASILSKEAREVDFVARVGDDEFALILPETGRLGAIRLAERLCSEIASYPFPMPEGAGSINLTASGGIASYPNCGEGEQDIITRAYEALDDAKRGGGNRVKLWEPRVSDI